MPIKTSQRGNIVIISIIVVFVIILLIVLAVFALSGDNGNGGRALTSNNDDQKGEQIKSLEVDSLKKRLIGTYMVTELTTPKEASSSTEIVKQHEDNYILRLFPDGTYTYTSINGLAVRNVTPSRDVRQGNYLVTSSSITFIDFISDKVRTGYEGIVNPNTFDVTFAYTYAQPTLTLTKQYQRTEPYPTPTPSVTPIPTPVPSILLSPTPSPLLSFTYGLKLQKITTETANTQEQEIQYFIRIFEENLKEGNYDGIYASFANPDTEEELRDELTFAEQLVNAQGLSYRLHRWQFVQKPSPKHTGPIVKQGSTYKVHVTETRSNYHEQSDTWSTEADYQIIFNVISYAGSWKIAKYYFATEDEKQADKFSALRVR